MIRNVIFAIPVSYFTKVYGHDYSFFAGAFGGFIGSIISHPFDIIKTEMQRCGGSNMSMINIFKDIYKFNPLKLWSSQ